MFNLNLYLPMSKLHPEPPISIVEDIKEIRAPSRAWQIDLGAGGIAWQMPFGVGPGIVQGEMGVFSFTTSPRPIRKGFAIYGAWNPYTVPMVPVHDTPATDGPEVPRFSCDDALLIGDSPLLGRTLGPLSPNGTGNSFFFRGRMSIDNDGAPNAYAPLGVVDPNGNPPLDHLINAGDTRNWYGLETDNGKKTGNPLKQTASDPFPGFYISKTALQRPHSTPIERNVDARTVPYIVLPKTSFKVVGGFNFPHGARLGDYAAVINLCNERSSGAVFADVNANTQGEGSRALARALRLNHGTDDGTIVYLVFPGSGRGWPPTSEQINATGLSLFKQWGGRSLLNACFTNLKRGLCP